MKFKYQQEYKTLKSTCPPSDYSEQDLDSVYRWVFDTMDNPNNFQPQYYKKPKRFLNSDDITKCKALGLSFFNDLDGSIERFNELKEQIGQNVYLTLGTNIAQGVINKSDGVNGQVERLGHFTHHTSDNAKYENNFAIIQQL